MVEIKENNDKIREEMHKVLDSCLDIEEIMVTDLAKSEFVTDMMKIMLKLAITRGADALRVVN